MSLSWARPVSVAAMSISCWAVQGKTRGDDKGIAVSKYEAMGDVFEDRERALFGENGFETMVAKVAGIEERLGIYDLSRFTPRVQRPSSRTVSS